MEDEITLDLRDFFFILRKRAKLIVAITLIATILSGIISFFVIKPTYEATLSVFIGKNENEQSQKVSYDNSDVMMYQKLVKTYATIAKTNDVLEKVIEKLKLDTTTKKLDKMIEVTPQQDTQIMDIKVQNKDPEKARKIAETLTPIFIEKSKVTIPNGNVQILDKVQVPEKPIKPHKILNVAIAFFLGLMVSVGLVFMLEYMDNTIKTQDDIEKYLEIPVLGTIPNHLTE
ncbi:YveK family protein [Clostridium botulinum]|uniref:Capsular biosynthesis protein n=1 Tax=Clostridium botulinum TaxID=1491 RepID=A0A9Q1UZ30_CLOBO|nr:Wzz/FepE/Etk N-terminal domain-containing protein [Clostridium botulinum]AEB75385.1 Cps19aC, putative [Clostridium botulinum BKT015925]KEH99901.1 capsular biosynthesis protein [Clostridium botulinum D str. 16868]KEI03779.1 capsular biosynthesis protein [Clostridium botulinum C/D str. Sp77]KLU76349.1 capsular biosynthesis protein [Clostridium botulinum V891]KOA73647.1 capsular biosynthesis protein [Clostridium botulinum]